MTLPSPIPHPGSYLDTHGRWRDEIEFVLGSHWPEGDELAMRALAADWRQAAQKIRHTMEEAGQAARDAVAGFGGSDSGSAFQEAWQEVDSALEDQSFERLAELAEAGAETIEVAKRDIYTEVTGLVDALAQAGGGTLLEETRAAVERLARQAAARMHELALGPISEIEVLRPFAFRPSSSEGGSETAGVPASVSAPVGATTPQPEGALLYAAGIASLGSPSVPVTRGSSAGPRTVTALKGRYGERAIRAPGGEVLSAISIGVIAKEGVEWSGLANTGTSAPAPTLAGVAPVAGHVISGGRGDDAASVPPAGLSPTAAASSVAAPAPSAAVLSGGGVAAPAVNVGHAGAPVGLPPSAALASAGQSGGSAGLASPGLASAGLVSAGATSTSTTSAVAVPGGAGTASAVGGVVPGGAVPGGAGTASAVSGAAASAGGTGAAAGASAAGASAAGAASTAGAASAAMQGGASGASAGAGSGAGSSAATRPGTVSPATTAATAGASSLPANAPGGPPGDGDPAGLVATDVGLEEETTIVPWLIVAAIQDTPSAAGAPQTTGETLPDAEAYERHVLSLLSRPEDQAAQQLWRESVQREGGVAQRAHQLALEIAIERDESGGPTRFPDLTAPWLGLVNAGGPLADRRRATNAADVALSLVDTWLHGRPRAALPGTHEKIQELNRLAADPQGLSKLEAALKVQGHGACAVMVQEWPYGEVHATTVHNQHGELVYVDAQRVDQPLNAEPVPGAVRMEILAFGPEGKRIDIGG